MSGTRDDGAPEGMCFSLSMDCLMDGRSSFEVGGSVDRSAGLMALEAIEEIFHSSAFVRSEDEQKKNNWKSRKGGAKQESPKRRISACS